MFDVIKKLLFSRQLVFEKGEIKLLGQSVTMIPVTLYVEMFKELKKVDPKKYGKIIYNISREVGKEYTKTLKEKYKMETQELAKWDVNTLELAGLGKGNVVSFDTKIKKSIIRVNNSPIAQELRPQKKPVDFVIAGYIAGSASIAMNSNKIHCRETKCEAKGDSFCLFEIYEAK